MASPCGHKSHHRPTASAPPPNLPPTATPPRCSLDVLYPLSLLLPASHLDSTLCGGCCRVSNLLLLFSSNASKLLPLELWWESACFLDDRATAEAASA